MNGLRIVAQANGDEINLDILNDIVNDKFEAEIFGGTTAESVATTFKGQKPKVVNVRINSNGGSAYEGIAIHNLLREQANNGAQVNVKVLGIAASAASIIAVAGDKVTMASGSKLMMHNAGISGRLSFANAADLRAKADQLDQCDNSLASIYATRSRGKLSCESALALMAKTTYLSDREAVHNGLATETDPELQAVALGEDFGAFAPSQAAKPNQEKIPMIITKEQLVAENPEIANALRLEGREQAKTEIATSTATERTRIRDILALKAGAPGHDTDIEAMAYDGSTTVDQAKAKLFDIEAQARVAAAALLGNPAAPRRAVDPAASGSVPAAAASTPLAQGGREGERPAVDPNATVGVQAKQKWDSDPDIRAEFVNESSYIAFCKREAEGSIHIHNKGKE